MDAGGRAASGTAAEDARSRLAKAGIHLPAAGRVIYSIHSRVAGMPNFKINDLRHCQIIGFEAAYP